MVSPPVMKPMHRLSMLCGSLAVLIGLVVPFKASWSLGAPVALAFVLLGGALIGRVLLRWRLVGRVAAWAVLGLALTSLSLSFISGSTADLLAGAGDGPMRSGQMALGTALAFLMASLALLLASESPKRQRLSLSVWLSLAVILTSLVTFFAYLMGVDISAGLAQPIRMSLLPALGHLCLGVGLLALRPQDDFMRVASADNSVGVFARRLGLSVLGLTTLFGVLWLYLFKQTLFDAKEMQVLFTVIYLAGGMLLTVWSVRVAGSLAEGREVAEDEQGRLLARIQQQAASLQEQVAVRTRELEEANKNLQAVAHLNTQLSLVASHTTSGVIISDRRGLIEWVNKAWEHMSGYTLAEAIGRKPGDFLRGPGTDQLTTQKLSAAVQQGKSCYVEILNYAKDARPYWQILDIEPLKNERGEVVNFISVQTDITQYRESQQQLQALTERLQLALHFSGYGVWEVDLRSGFMSWDARMFELYGLAREKFDSTRESWRRCMHPEDLLGAEQKFTDLVAGRVNNYNLQFRILRPNDGEIRTLEAQGYLQHDESGRAVRVVGLNRDITTERQQREQLHAYTERLQLALRASGYGVWDMDTVNGKIHWDGRQCEIYGVPPDRFDGSYTSWIGLMHPDDRERAEANIEAATDQGDEFDNVFRIIRPDGTIRHIESHGYLRRDNAGRLVRAVGMDRDVTAEQEMEEALRLAEERWQLALTGTNDGVWDWDLTNGSMFFDPRYAEILGYLIGELPQDDRGWMVLVHPEDLSEAMAARERHLAAQNTLYSAEHRMRTKDGDWKWVLGRGKVVARDGTGRPLRMVGTLSDITQRKQLEQTLRRNQELAEHVGRMALIGGWEYNLRDNNLYWSASVRHIHEVSAEYKPEMQAAIGFCDPEMRAVMQAAFHRCLHEGEPFDLELPLTTANGHRIWVRTLGRAESNSSPHVRLYGAYQDITARHEAEEARRQLEKQLFQSQKMETLGTLAGGIAHDFNNLLTGIMGYHDLAADMLPEGHDVRNYLSEARQASMRARELVEQILTFSRQQESPERMSVDLGLLVGEARRFLRATLPATIQIHAEIEADCPRVLADSTQLHQVLLNLGSNGAQAMGERGGVLKFTMSTVEIDPVRASALGGLSAGRYICLGVTDWGQGIDEATLKRIFDPFFTTKKPGEGTGLGLSVVHGIVRSHQGGIEVESTLGVGTTFRIYLPEAASEMQEQSSSRASIPQGRGDTIFLVDDEEVVAKFAGIALERMGYKVVTFDAALPCLEAIQAHPEACHVLLTDQTMPGLTGTDLIEAVHVINPKLRAVLMSGYFTKVSSQTLDRLSHVELLNKPFTSDELALAVQRALVPLTQSPEVGTTDGDETLN